jgi:hypothetical protein
MIVTIFTGNIGSVKPVAQVGDSKVLNLTLLVINTSQLKTVIKSLKLHGSSVHYGTVKKFSLSLKLELKLPYRETFQQGHTSTKKMLKRLLQFLLVLLIQLNFKVK